MLQVPHMGGRYANLNWHDPNLEAVIEVYSEWGEFDWFLRQALAKGFGSALQRVVTITRGGPERLLREAARLVCTVD